MKNLREICKKPGFWIRAVIIMLALGALGWLMVEVNQPLPGTDMSYFSEYGYYKARVTAILYDDAEHDHENSEGLRVGSQTLEIQFLNGPRKGEVETLDNYLTALGNVDAKVGTTIVVRYTKYSTGNVSILMYNYDRTMALGFILLVFCVAVILIGGKKGLMSLLGLVFTLFCLWFLLIPAMLRGYDMMLVTVALSAAAAAACLLLLNGFTNKTYAAILGCVMGVSAAGFCTWLVERITPLSGMNMDEAERLFFHATQHGMSISGLLVCGVLIASLGAVMDVSMSISSAMHEIYEANTDFSRKRLFTSGMNVGKDAMGTMTNTLILALIGSSLNTFILTQAYEIPFSQLLNTDFIVIELVQGVAGAIGIVLTVPLVAFLSAWMMAGRGANRSGRVKYQATQPPKKRL